jgi:hypothetical protein
LLTLYQGARNPVPLRADDWPSWAELCSDLAVLLATEATEKTDLFAIGPHRLAKPYRLDANVAALDLLALDVDRCDASALLDRIEALGLAAAVYGSPSDDPTKPDTRRVRVLAPASRPILPAECAATRCAFAELLELEPGQGVEACLNPGGLFFVGRIEGTPPRAWAWRDGAAVDVDGLLAVPLALDWRPGKAPTGASPAAASGGLPTAEPTDRAAELADLVRERWLDGGRIESHAALNLFGWLLGRGWRRAELVALLDLLDQDEPAAGKRAEHRRILGRAVALDGPGAAREWLGEDWPAVDALANPEREAARAMLADRAARAPAGDDRPGPVIVSSRRDAGAVFVDLGPDEGGYQPVAVEHVPRVLADLGLAVEPLEGRKREAPRALIDRLGELYTRAAYDYAARTSRYERETRTLIVGYPLRPVEPRQDAAVDAWLRALGGGDYPRLAAWLASCDQRYIDRLAAGLVLVGPKDAGKSLLAAALAGLWGECSPVGAGLLVDRFNADLLRCPIVCDEEAALVGSGELSTKRFRDALQATERAFEPKGRERILLRGALRFVVPCNAVGDLKFADLSAGDVLDAVADRLLVIDLAPRAPACRDALARLRLPGSWRVDLPRVIAHLSWLAGAVTPPVERFIGGGGAAGRAAVLAGHAEQHSRVWYSLADWLDCEDPAAATGAARAWAIVCGELLCDVRALADALGGADDRRVDRDVREALAPVRRGLRRPWRGGEDRARLAVIDADGAADALRGNGHAEALRARLAASL